MESRKDYQAELDRCMLLAGFTAEELSAFMNRAKFESFPRGAEILTEGKSYHGVWLLACGKCEVVKHGPHRDSRLAVLEPGSVFGEMSFLQAVPHSATVRALENVETIRLMREEFEDLSEQCPSAARKIAINIVRVLSDRLRRMDQWTCELVDMDTSHAKKEEWQEFRSKLYSGLFE